MNDWISNYYLYSAVFAVTLFIAVFIVGKKQALKVTGLFFPFMGIMIATYWLKPLIDLYLGSPGHYYLPYFLRELFARNINKICLAVFLSLVFFSLGFRIVYRTLSLRWAINSLNCSLDIMPASIKFLCILLLLLGYYSLLKYSVFPGVRDIYAVSMTPTEAGSIFTNTTGYFVLAHDFIRTACVLIYAWTGNLWLTLGLAGPWVVGKLYSGWARSSLLFLLVAIMLTAIFNKSKYGEYIKKHLALTLILVLAFLSFFPVMRQNRTIFLEEGFSARKTAHAIVNTYDRKDKVGLFDDLAGFQDTLYFLELAPQQIPFQYGIPYFYNYFIEPIPRILWPGKPLLTDLTHWWDPHRYGAINGAIGDAYLQFGWNGILLIFFITGSLFAFVQFLFDRLYTSPSITTGYVLFFAWICQIGRDSFLALFPTYMLFTGIPVIIAYYLERRNFILLSYSILSNKKSKWVQRNKIGTMEK